MTRQERQKLEFVTPAGLAERFGAEAVLGTYEPTYEEKGLAALMHVSTLQVTTGTVLGSRTTAALTLTGPDLGSTGFPAWNRKRQHSWPEQERNSLRSWRNCYLKIPSPCGQSARGFPCRNGMGSGALQ